MRPTSFTVTTTGPDRLGLLAVTQRFVDEQWTPDHMTPDQAAASLPDQFKRAVMGELGMLVEPQAERETGP